MAGSVPSSEREFANYVMPVFGPAVSFFYVPVAYIRYRFHTRLDLIHTRLDLIHTQLIIIHNQLDLIHALLDLIHR
jgi:hypothetical protein